MKQSTSPTVWFTTLALACAAAIGTGLLAAKPAAAQTAPASQPGCTMANMTSPTAPSGAAGAVGFACVADLDGNGTSELVVGAILNVSGQGGYALYITNNGAIRKKICWGVAGCPTSP